MDLRRIPTRVTRMRAVLVALPLAAAAALAGTPAIAQSPAASDGAGSLAGKRVGVVLCCQAAILDQFTSWIQAAAASTGRGEEFTILNANGDAQKALEIAESFIAQDYDAIMSVPLTFDGWDGIAQEALAKGMVITNHSASPVTDAQLNVLYPHKRAGYLNGVNAGNWLKEKLGGVGEVGMGVFPDDANLKSRSDGFADGIKSVIPDIQIWEANAGSDVPSGASVGANLLQAHPDIKVFFGWNEEVAVGMLQAATEAGRTDPTQFYVGTPDATPVGFEKIKDGTPMQAIVTPGFPFSVSQWLFLTEQAMLGEQIPPTGLINVHLVDASSVDAEIAAQSDPLAPASADLLANGLVMLDTPVAFGDPIPDVGP